MNYNSFFTDALDRLHAERRYRVFADLERIAGRFPHARIIAYQASGARAQGGDDRSRPRPPGARCL